MAANDTAAPPPLANRVILVTGANGGLGEAVARASTAAGADVDTGSVDHDIGTVGRDDACVVAARGYRQHDMVTGQGAQVVDQRADVIAGFQQDQAATPAQRVGGSLDPVGQFGVGELLRTGEHRHAVAVATEVLERHGVDPFRAAGQGRLTNVALPAA